MNNRLNRLAGAAITVLLSTCTLSAQTNGCSDAAGGQYTSSATCVYSAFDSDGNTDYWNGATGCGATDNDDAWGWFVATNNYTTVQYNPNNNHNPILTLFDGTVGNCSVTMPSIACANAYGNGGTEALTIPTVIGHRYRIRLQRQGSDNDMNGDICIRGTATPPPVNNTCSLPNPICSGSPISFIANAGGNPASVVNPGNAYGCLDSSPNPSWYYMEIDQSGVLAVNITAGSDVDFRLWGPFANLAIAQAGCNSYGSAVDCSFSSSATEQANANVLAGQVWVLLVTNYANTIQTININEAGSNTASTNCAIVPLPVGYSNWEIDYFNEQVQLVWTTESEQNNEKFYIQRSEKGLIWETIGAVAGKGNTDAPSDYVFYDKQPISGLSYYRLQQVDQDGKSSYTSILSVTTGQDENSLKVFPNPAANSFTVRTKGSAADAIVLTDIVGKAYPVTCTADGNDLIVNCEQLAQGSYTLTVISKGKKTNKRILIGR